MREGATKEKPETSIRERVQTPAILDAYVSGGLLAREDVAATRMLVELAQQTEPALDPSPAAWVAMCLALRAPRDSHTCVDLAAIPAPPAMPAEEGDVILLPPDWPTDTKSWKGALATAGSLLSTTETDGPFAIDADRLYLARSLRQEEEIARRLRGGVADAVNVRILLGGPGTGKTTEVAKQLIDRFRNAPDTRIALAAPTGKAAARMAEALRQRLTDPRAPEEILNASAEVRAAVEAARPVTIHALLGYRPQAAPRYRFHAGAHLIYDLVVLDETSMLSSSLMLHLLEALRPGTELLLVGDPDQLASVDAGSVLGDIAQAAVRAGSPLAARTTTLNVRHRFGPRIGALADAILAADADRVLGILTGAITPPPDPHNAMPDDPGSVRWVVPGSSQYRQVLAEVCDHATLVRTAVDEDGPATALAEQRKLQVLCAHRSGRMGVAGWNAVVEQQLRVAGGQSWYPGRPVMVTRNNRSLGLFNGDVGVVVPAKSEAGGPAGSRMAVAFPTTGEPRLVPVSRLEDVITVHALTIHKSQGSEYGHAVVVLPERPSRVVTRELLYTGVTRASGRVTLVATEEVIRAAIATPIRRATGLAGRLA
jgi:exodeoxyribonuclease V alpha subunit